MEVPAPSVTSSRAVIASVLEGEDLSNEEIQKLLRQAEHRLRENAVLPDQKISLSESSMPKLDVGHISQPYMKSDGGICRVDSTCLVVKDVRDLADQPKKPKVLSVEKKKLAEKKQATAGPDWFHLPRTNLSDKMKMDVKLLGMRSVLDPKRHYRKKNLNPNGPKYSQVGTIIEGPTEYFSARLRNKERKRTIVEEVMTGEAETGRFKREYLKRQVAKTSGKKRTYRDFNAKQMRKRR